MKLHTMGTDEGALGMLRACHARIRSFSDLAARLGEARTASPEAIAESASALHRYFSVAFPLHAQDEDVDLAPLLLARDTGSEVEALIAQLPVDHRALDAILAQLLPAWTRLRSEPTALGEFSAALCEGAERFRTRVLAHAEAEEALLFPAAAKLLSPEELRALGASMRERRADAAPLVSPGRVPISG